MTNETIALVLALLSKTYWNMDYYQFLDCTGFTDDEYALEKFKLFQGAVEQLNRFDPETMVKIISSAV